MAGSAVAITVESICSMKSATARMSGTMRFIGRFVSVRKGTERMRSF
jgi:hypothetical protein